MSDRTEAVTYQQVSSWADNFEIVSQRLSPYFSRSEPREHTMAYLHGLLSPAERKNSWQLAEMTGATTPYRYQHLLGRARWNEDAVRDELQRYVVEHLGTSEAVVVIDETGFLKKGKSSAGVARQYSGTAGRIENSQIGVFLTYATCEGQTLIDRELYLPKRWTQDRKRCRQAGIPDDRAFYTKPQLAKQMLERLFDTDTPIAWVTADSVYGDDRTLRIWLEEQECSYVLAVSGKAHIWSGWEQLRISQILETLPQEGWQRLSAGAGSKGPRWYDWLRLPIGTAMQEAGRRWLLVRRSLTDPNELTAFVVYAPAGTSLAVLVTVAGMRWTTEIAFEAAKSEVGLDEYEVRSWTGWYRHITLSMWALAILTAIRATELEPLHPKKGGTPAAKPDSMAAFKANRGL
jgi:SRSO17 transposase